MDFPPFPGFRPAAFKFLRELRDNNNRDWFKERKDLYDQEVVWPLKCLVADVGRALDGAPGMPLMGDPKNGVFRIHRDVRFSKNKDPYKLHAAGVLSPDGSKKGEGGLYIHVEPRNCFTAAGFWQPDNKVLGKWRERIASDPKGFTRLVSRLKKASLPIEQHGDGLKRLPRGFEDHAGSSVEEYLKFKSFLVVRNYTQKELQSQEFVDAVAGFAKDARPLLNFGWEIAND